MRQQSIRWLLRALAAARAPGWLPPPSDAAGVVLTLHHVAPPRISGFAPNAHLSITPDFLDAALSRLGANGWRFVALMDLVTTSATGAAASRRLAVTLDDGFRDNLEHALPVFRRHGVPFTIFVCPGFCDASTEIWWEALERIVAGTDTIYLDGAGPAAELPTRSVPEKRRAFALWTRWLTIAADEARQRAVIRALAERYGLDLAALARELVMDWDRVREVAADPLCAIGAHTMTHPALARLEVGAALAEIRESADRIEAEIGTRPATIAFPYGYAAAAGQREAELAKAAGFAAAFTTRPGYVPTGGSRHFLPRISVNGHYQDARQLEVLLTPGLWKLRNRLRKVG